MEPSPPDGEHDPGRYSETAPPDFHDISSCSSECVSSRDQHNGSIVENLNSDARVVNGDLSLSNQNLTGLSPSFKVEYLEVVDLDVSRNHMHSLKSKWFPNCTSLDISYNFLTRLASLYSLATTLRQLNASHNDICCLDGIQQFLRLERINVVNNALRTFPLLDTHSLRILEVDANLLSEVPDFSRLCNLEVLGLSNNKLMHIENISGRLPNSLRELNIAGNPIADITQLLFLSPLQRLQKLTIYPLPCIPLTDAPPFNYKHLVLCILHDLLHIDGESVQSADLICGEHLTLLGKVTGSKREFLPGGGEEAHNYLCAYLAKVTGDCVETQSTSSTPLRARMMKALHMKEQYDSEGSSARSVLSPRQDQLSCGHASEDEFSTHSPFANWSRQMGKENTDPELTDASSQPSNRSSIARGRRLIETGVGRKAVFRRSGSVGSRLSSYASAMKAEVSSESHNNTDEDDVLTLKGSTPTASGRSSPTPLYEEQDPPKPKPRTTTLAMSKPSSAEKHDVLDERLEFSPIPIHSTPSRSTRAMDVTMIHSAKRTLPVEDRLSQLEETVSVLLEQNDMLSKTNEELSCLLTEQHEKYTSMIENCEKMINRLARELEKPLPPPTPFALGVIKRNENSAEVKWELRHVQEYAVFIDGQNAGRVMAPSRVARISDLDPHKSHTVQLQAISLDGVPGELSLPLTISPLND